MKKMETAIYLLPHQKDHAHRDFFDLPLGAITK